MKIIGIYFLVNYLNRKLGLEIVTEDVIQFIITNVDTSPNINNYRTQTVGINLYSGDVMTHRLKVCDYSIMHYNPPFYKCYQFAKLDRQFYFLKGATGIISLYIIIMDAENAYRNHDDYIIEGIRRILGLPGNE